MSKEIINKDTEEKIKNYLSEEKVKESQASISDNFGAQVNKSKNKNKKIFFAFLFFIIIAIIVSFVLLRNQGQQSFDKSQVSVNIQAPGIISSGDNVVFELKYNNSTNVDLKKTKISFFIPKGFIFVSSDKQAEVEKTVITWNVDNVIAHESGSIKIFGKVYGEVGKEFDFDSKIAYYPDNFNYEFQSSDSSSKAKVKIFSVPFELSAQLPNEVTSGESIELVVKFKNKSKLDFENVVLELQISNDFKLLSSAPEPSEEKEDSRFYRFEEVGPEFSGKIVIQGSYFNEQNINEEIKIKLNANIKGEDFFEYINRNSVVRVEEIPIAVEQYVNGSKEYSAVQGEQLEYVIKFKNKSESEIKGLVIQSKVEGEIDFESLEVSNGSYDKDSNTITWSAFNVPKLALFGSLDDGEVSFKVKIKDYIEVKKPDDKNYIIRNNVKISNFNFDSKSVNVEKIIARSESNVKLDTKLFIRSKGYFNDDGRIKNTGTIPPEVGKKTTYLIHWYLSSLFNDLKNLRISAVLPEGVSWTGNYINSNGKLSFGNENNGAVTPSENKENLTENINNKQSEKKIERTLEPEIDSEKTTVNEEDILNEDFYYNTKTREVFWEIPFLAANTGISSPAKEVVFQISIKPTELDIGKTMVLSSKISAVGFDEFVQKEITALESELTTELPDDYSIGINEGIIVDNSEKEATL